MSDGLRAFMVGGYADTKIGPFSALIESCVDDIWIDFLKNNSIN